jgi:hypothetical protein
VSDIAKQDDAKLAAKISDAIKEVEAADTIKKEKVIIAGRLLVEAQKRHPDDKAFAKFLELAGGIQIRRAKDFIAIALGRKDFEQHQIENAAAQQRHRDKIKAEKIEREKEAKALPEPEPNPAKPEPKPDALRNATSEPKPEPKPDASAMCLREFEAACMTCLPKLNISDLRKADELYRRVYVDLSRSRRQTKREAA